MSSCSKAKRSRPRDPVSTTCTVAEGMPPRTSSPSSASLSALSSTTKLCPSVVASFGIATVTYFWSSAGSKAIRPLPNSLYRTGVVAMLPAEDTVLLGPVPVGVATRLIREGVASFRELMEPPGRIMDHLATEAGVLGFSSCSMSTTYFKRRPSEESCSPERRISSCFAQSSAETLCKAEANCTQAFPVPFATATGTSSTLAPRTPVTILLCS
mmetsp:Transcript_98607/g.317942  ORF Transcript_98607/g.317942 Transcript_98607/m.317942 type:complete len:213 (-) Transcript_98607:365-1003(-)